ncbi:hypothetical protein VKT23_015774 [Stygiomarasmius scandens]|uniref:Uncharacterized protein n=1 Tax=Marasmiellus scandens TaxID=2682957 RepID=A0ABR1IWQ8_9AGAR
MAGKRGRPRKYFTPEEKKAARKRIDGKYYRIKGKALRQRKKEEKLKQMQSLETNVVSTSADLIPTEISPIASNSLCPSPPPTEPAALSSSLPPSSPQPSSLVSSSDSSLQLSSPFRPGPWTKRTVLKPIRRGDKPPVKRTRSPSPNYPIRFFGPLPNRKRCKFVICDSDSEDNTLPMASSVENSPH